MFIWLLWVLVVAHGIFVAACGIFCCGMQALCCSVRALELTGSGVAAYGLSSCGAWAPEHTGSVDAVCRLKLPCGMWDLSCLTRDRTRVPYIGRRILNHWTTREISDQQFKKKVNFGVDRRKYYRTMEGHENKDKKLIFNIIYN